MVFFLDVLKGVIPVLVARLLYPENDLLWVIAGIGALLGHVYPVYFRFQGGKGTSTYLGVAIGLLPIWGLVLFVLLIITTLISDYIVVGTVFLLVPLPIIMIVTGNFNWIGIALISLFVVLNLYRHSNNFVALFKGEEKGVREGLKGKE